MQTLHDRHNRVDGMLARKRNRRLHRPVGVSKVQREKRGRLERSQGVGSVGCDGHVHVEAQGGGDERAGAVGCGRDDQ